MDQLSSAVFASWTFSSPLIAALLVTLAIYLRGWLAGRRVLQSSSDVPRLWSFIGGLLAIFIALASPLNSFDSFFLSAHMTQHLLLIVVASPLLLFGQPFLPMLRGLPKPFVKEGLGPFFTFAPLRRAGDVITSIPFAWLAAALSTVLWHIPRFYELALSSPAWHGAQHACFFWTGVLFWWPVIRQFPNKNRYPEWAFIPYLLFADIVNTVLSAYFIFSGRALYPSYQTVRLAGFSPQDDQALAGGITWVPGSLVYLIPAFIMTLRLLATRPPVPEFRAVQSLRHPSSRQPLLRAKQLPTIRRWAQAVMLIIACAVMADGFLGPQAAPLNLAGVLPWIYWRGFSVLALLVLGNLFCLSCPFTLVRDWGRRFLPANRRWPRVLRSKWVPIILLVLYLWSYEAFGLWNSPFLTASIIAGYFLAALLIDGVFQGASFCKYVCPIGQFHFVTSLVSPKEVGVRSQAVCQSCRTHDCIRGNSQARGCELDLFQPKKSSSLDCTFCMDCVKACPHDNVTLLRVLPAATVISDPYRSSLRRLSKRTDWAALALLIVFGAFVNAGGMIEPVMMYEHRWHARLGPGAMPLITGIFVLTGAVLLPALVVLLSAVLNRAVSDARSTLDYARRFSFALVPIGVGMWTAHLIYHLVTSADSVAPALARLTGANAAIAATFIPAWLTPVQILILNTGLLLTLWVIWKIAVTLMPLTRKAVGLFAPWAVVAVSLYVIGIVILLEPMEMRGMMMH